MRTYWQLSEIEATFHSKREGIRAHLFIAVLAYHAVNLLRHRLQARGHHDSWETIRNKLSG